MEKRFRDYLRHLEKLDFDVISEEEIWEEREGLELKLTEIHQEMMRTLIPMMAFFICACIFLAVAFANFYVGYADSSLDVGGEFAYTVIGAAILFFGVWVAATTLDD